MVIESMINPFWLINTNYGSKSIMQASANVLYHMMMHPTMPEENAKSDIPNSLMMGFYSALLALGIIIYISWGLLYGTWNLFERTNLGMYTITVLLCGFGIAGIVLYRTKQKQG